MAQQEYIGIAVYRDFEERRLGGRSEKSVSLSAHIVWMRLITLPGIDMQCKTCGAIERADCHCAGRPRYRNGHIVRVLTVANWEVYAAHLRTVTDDQLLQHAGRIYGTRLIAFIAELWQAGLLDT